MVMTDDNLTAYARFLLRDDALTAEEPLPGNFHERFPAHFVGQRTQDGIWPDHSADRTACARYSEGQAALYETKDPVAAIRAYSEAIECDPTYLHAWVALGIAYVMDNTDESLERGQEIFERLCALEVGDWLSREAASILRQNLGYVHLVHYRKSGEPSRLVAADTEYARAEALAEQERVELLCPWAFVKWERGDRAGAQALWARAHYAAPSPQVLQEYAAKYAALRDLPNIFSGELR